MTCQDSCFNVIHLLHLLQQKCDVYFNGMSLIAVSAKQCHISLIVSALSTSLIQTGTETLAVMTLVPFLTMKARNCLVRLL